MNAQYLTSAELLIRQTEPSETRNLLEFLEQEATPNIRIGIAINEADFREILQRSRRVSLGKIVLASVVVPTAINLLSNYIQRKCIDRAEEVSVHVELVVTRPDGESILIKFDGPAEKLGTVISQAVEENSQKRLVTHNDSAGEEQAIGYDMAVNISGEKFTKARCVLM